MDGADRGHVREGGQLVEDDRGFGHREGHVVGVGGELEGAGSVTRRALDRGGDGERGIGVDDVNEGGENRKPGLLNRDAVDGGAHLDAEVRGIDLYGIEVAGADGDAVAEEDLADLLGADAGLGHWRGAAVGDGIGRVDGGGRDGEGRVGGVGGEGELAEGTIEGGGDGQVVGGADVGSAGGTDEGDDVARDEVRVSRVGDGGGQTRNDFGTRGTAIGHISVIIRAHRKAVAGAVHHHELGEVHGAVGVGVSRIGAVDRDGGDLGIGVDEISQRGEDGGPGVRDRGGIHDIPHPDAEGGAVDGDDHAVARLERDVGVLDGANLGVRGVGGGLGSRGGVGGGGGRAGGDADGVEGEGRVGVAGREGQRAGDVVGGDEDVSGGDGSAASQPGLDGRLEGGEDLGPRVGGGGTGDDLEGLAVDDEGVGGAGLGVRAGENDIGDLHHTRAGGRGGREVEVAEEGDLVDVDGIDGEGGVGDLGREGELAGGEVDPDGDGLAGLDEGVEAVEDIGPGGADRDRRGGGGGSRVSSADGVGEAGGDVGEVAGGGLVRDGGAAVDDEGVGGAVNGLDTGEVDEEVVGGAGGRDRHPAAAAGRHVFGAGDRNRGRAGTGGDDDGVADPGGGGVVVVDLAHQDIEDLGQGVRAGGGVIVGRRADGDAIDGAGQGGDAGEVDGAVGRVEIGRAGGGGRAAGIADTDRNGGDACTVGDVQGGAAAARGVASARVISDDGRQLGDDLGQRVVVRGTGGRIGKRRATGDGHRVNRAGGNRGAAEDDETVVGRRGAGRAGRGGGAVGDADDDGGEAGTLRDGQRVAAGAGHVIRARIVGDDSRQLDQDLGQRVGVGGTGDGISEGRAAGNRHREHRVNNHGHAGEDDGAVGVDGVGRADGDLRVELVEIHRLGTGERDHGVGREAGDINGAVSGAGLDEVAVAIDDDLVDDIGGGGVVDVEGDLADLRGGGAGLLDRIRAAVAFDTAGDVGVVEARDAGGGGEDRVDRAGDGQGQVRGVDRHGVAGVGGLHEVLQRAEDRGPAEGHRAIAGNDIPGAHGVRGAVDGHGVEVVGVEIVGGVGVNEQDDLGGAAAGRRGELDIDLRGAAGGGGEVVRKAGVAVDQIGRLLGRARVGASEVHLEFVGIVGVGDQRAGNDEHGDVGGAGAAEQGDLAGVEIDDGVARTIDRQLDTGGDGSGGVAGDGLVREGGAIDGDGVDPAGGDRDAGEVDVAIEVHVGGGGGGDRADGDGGGAAVVHGGGDDRRAGAGGETDGRRAGDRGGVGAVGAGEFGDGAGGVNGDVAVDLLRALVGGGLDVIDGDGAGGLEPDGVGIVLLEADLAVAVGVGGRRAVTVGADIVDGEVAGRADEEGAVAGDGEGDDEGVGVADQEAAGDAINPGGLVGPGVGGAEAPGAAGAGLGADDVVHEGVDADAGAGDEVEVLGEEDRAAVALDPLGLDHEVVRSGDDGSGRGEIAAGEERDIGSGSVAGDAANEAVEVEVGGGPRGLEIDVVRGAELEGGGVEGDELDDEVAGVLPDEGRSGLTGEGLPHPRLGEAAGNGGEVVEAGAAAPDSDGPGDANILVGHELDVLGGEGAGDREGIGRVDDDRVGLEAGGEEAGNDATAGHDERAGAGGDVHGRAGTAGGVSGVAVDRGGQGRHHAGQGVGGERGVGEGVAADDHPIEPARGDGAAGEIDGAGGAADGVDRGVKEDAELKGDAGAVINQAGGVEEAIETDAARGVEGDAGGVADAVGGGVAGDIARGQRDLDVARGADEADGAALHHGGGEDAEVALRLDKHAGGAVVGSLDEADGKAGVEFTGTVGLIEADVARGGLEAGDLADAGLEAGDAGAGNEVHGLGNQIKVGVNGRLGDRALGAEDDLAVGADEVREIIGIRAIDAAAFAVEPELANENVAGAGGAGGVDGGDPVGPAGHHAGGRNDRGAGAGGKRKGRAGGGGRIGMSRVVVDELGEGRHHAGQGVGLVGRGVDDVDGGHIGEDRAADGDAVDAARVKGDPGEIQGAIEGHIGRVGGVDDRGGAGDGGGVGHAVLGQDEVHDLDGAVRGEGEVAISDEHLLQGELGAAGLDEGDVAGREGLDRDRVDGRDEVEAGRDDDGEAVGDDPATADLDHVALRDVEDHVTAAAGDDILDGQGDRSFTDGGRIGVEADVVVLARAEGLDMGGDEVAAGLDEDGAVGGDDIEEGGAAREGQDDVAGVAEDDVHGADRGVGDETARLHGGGVEAAVRAGKEAVGDEDAAVDIDEARGGGEGGLVNREDRGVGEADVATEDAGGERHVTAGGGGLDAALGVTGDAAVATGGGDAVHRGGEDGAGGKADGVGGREAGAEEEGDAGTDLNAVAGGDLGDLATGGAVGRLGAEALEAEDDVLRGGDGDDPVGADGGVGGGIVVGILQGLDADGVGDGNGIAGRQGDAVAGDELGLSRESGAGGGGEDGNAGAGGDGEHAAGDGGGIGGVAVNEAGEDAHDARHRVGGSGGVAEDVAATDGDGVIHALGDGGDSAEIDRPVGVGIGGAGGADLPDVHGGELAGEGDVAGGRDLDRLPGADDAGDGNIAAGVDVHGLAGENVAGEGAGGGRAVLVIDLGDELRLGGGDFLDLPDGLVVEDRGLLLLGLLLENGDEVEDVVIEAGDLEGLLEARVADIVVQGSPLIEIVLEGLVEILRILVANVDRDIHVVAVAAIGLTADAVVMRGQDLDLAVIPGVEVGPAGAGFGGGRVDGPQIIIKEVVGGAENPARAVVVGPGVVDVLVIGDLVEDRLIVVGQVAGGPLAHRAEPAFLIAAAGKVAAVVINPEAREAHPRLEVVEHAGELAGTLGHLGLGEGGGVAGQRADVAVEGGEDTRETAELVGGVGRLGGGGALPRPVGVAVQRGEDAAGEVEDAIAATTAVVDVPGGLTVLLEVVGGVQAGSAGIAVGGEVIVGAGLRVSDRGLVGIGADVFAGGVGADQAGGDPGAEGDRAGAGASAERDGVAGNGGGVGRTDGGAQSRHEFGERGAGVGGVGVVRAVNGEGVKRAVGRGEAGEIDSAVEIRVGGRDHVDRGGGGEADEVAGLAGALDAEDVLVGAEGHADVAVAPTGDIDGINDGGVARP